VARAHAARGQAPCERFDLVDELFGGQGPAGGSVGQHDLRRAVAQTFENAFGDRDVTQCNVFETAFENRHDGSPLNQEHASARRDCHRI
jgi:hypothetical protein